MAKENRLYDLELCYLTDIGRDQLKQLENMGLDRDLAVEVLHQLMTDEELYTLEP